MKRLLLLLTTILAGCECGPGVTCTVDSDCPSWGRCEREGTPRGSCVLRPVAQDAGADAGATDVDAGVDAGLPVASLSSASVDLAQAGCGVVTTDTVVVTNTGTVPLSVSASTGSSSVFSVAPPNGAVPAATNAVISAAAREI